MFLFHQVINECDSSLELNGSEDMITVTLDIPFVKKSLTSDNAVGIQDVYLLALLGAVEVDAMAFSVVTVAQCDKIWFVVYTRSHYHVLYRLKYLNHLIPFSNCLLSSSDFSQ